MAKTINILGVTGSIGQSAADVIMRSPLDFEVNVITAHSQAEKLAEMALKLKARKVVLVDKTKKDDLESFLGTAGIVRSYGQEALEDLASEPADLTIAAIVGMAGLKPLLKAIEGSKNVAIANKEPLVAAGPLVLGHAKACGTTILPVDSEHNAVFQLFDEAQKQAIDKITLTASGGPFRGMDAGSLKSVTVQQALNHPTWSMGPKISIDSATMMNKALEVIEAHYLFDMPAEKIAVVIHPQSVVHALVHYADGSVLAQMGCSDMRIPLAQVMGWPDRMRAGGDKLDLSRIGELSFEMPDYDTFFVLQLAYKCIELGPCHCIAFNAANEEAVKAFLTNHIGFLDIMYCIRHVVDAAASRSIRSIDDVLAADAEARIIAREFMLQSQKAA